ncbi:MAG: hypothetical protein IKL05_01150 [Clostridia bacterium]|nr:hypothetical protein [Clostridia bacterium]
MGQEKSCDTTQIRRGFGALCAYQHMPVTVTVDLRLTYCCFGSPSQVHSTTVHCRNHTTCDSLEALTESLLTLAHRFWDNIY